MASASSGVQTIINILITGPPLNQHRRLYFSVFIFICFLLALLSSQNGTIRWLDAQMYRFSSYLLPVQSPSNNYRVIELDEGRLQSPQGIKDLRTLLRKLKKARAAEIVWLSDDFPQMDFSEIDNKKKKKTSTSSDNEIDKELWEPTKGERTKLAWMLKSQGVFLTQYNNAPLKQNNIPYKETLHYQNGWRQYIPEIFLPQVQTFRLSNTQVSYRVYPFDSMPSDEQSLIWYNNERTSSLPDLSLAVFSRYKNSRLLSWDESGLIEMAGRKIPANLNGKVYNYFSELTGRHTNINSLSLSKASEKSNSYYRKKIVIIGHDINKIQILADSLSNLFSKTTYYTPSYNWWLMPILLAVVVIYLLFLLPLVSKQSGLFLGAFLILGIVSVQPVLLILKGLWWPTISILMLMLIGQSAVYVYLSGQKYLDNLVMKMQDCWFQLGHYQYEKGDYETAITSLLKCRPHEEVLSDLYEIGLSFERKRQYDRALQIYSEITARKKAYKDIDKRIESMTGFSDTSTEVLSPAQAQQTLVMPAMELPEFGRYKIEKELGRGAMGVVYLGKDPKINRRVAIKTLDYTQFSTAELKTVKDRFFREAEAAGRLSHSNIVTVYDVGEEEGFTFIAMDFVSGVPLSEYTKVGKLLPVHEVYRIVKVVAETLDYAHSQNIVHRDIKPGNIMYDPKNQQIKITDFGIARITDSVKTRTGSFMGSPSYMAPEQMTGSHVDGRADLYALGVSFYQLLTGKLPFDADSLGNLAYKITNEKHRPVRDVRDDLPSSATRIINKALQKKPEKRFASGEEFASALERGMPSA